MIWRREKLAYASSTNYILKREREGGKALVGHKELYVVYLRLHHVLSRRDVLISQNKGMIQRFWYVLNETLLFEK